MTSVSTKFLFVTLLSTFCALSTLLGNKSMAADGLPQEGVYSGTMSIVGNPMPVPVDVELKYTEQTTTADPDQIGLYTKLLLGTFFLDHEGGPYGFTSVTYDIETGLLDMRYIRPSLAATNVTNFRLLGHLNKDGSISGDVSSGSTRADLGTFTMKPSPNKARFVPSPVIVGQYAGTLTYTTKLVDKIEIDLEPTSTATTNPADLEVDFTPGRIGSVIIQSLTQPLSLAFSQVVVDYLRNIVRLTWATSNSAVGTAATTVTGATSSGSSITFIGSVSADANTISGVVNSSLLGKTGTFTVTRVK